MRILITGVSGSGASTLARALAAELSAPAFEVDDYFWMPTTPFKVERHPEKRLSMLVRDLAQVTSRVMFHWSIRVRRCLPR